jgi:hypothetical protein
VSSGRRAWLAGTSSPPRILSDVQRLQPAWRQLGDHELADAAVLRDGLAVPLAAARRRAVTLRFALAAASRLQRQLNPQAGLLPEV